MKTQVSLCKCTDSPEPSLHRKNREKQSFLGVISWDYDNIAAAVLRHAEFPEVRQSQKKKHLSLSNSTTVSDLSVKP